MFESYKYNFDSDSENEANIDFLKQGNDKNFDKILDDMNKFSDDIMLNSNPKKLQANAENYDQSKIFMDNCPLTEQINKNDNFLPEWKSEREYEKALDKIDKLYDKIMEPRFAEKPKENNNAQYEWMLNQGRNSDELNQQIYDQAGFNYPTIQQMQQNQNCQFNAPILIPIQPPIYQPIQNYQPNIQYYQMNAQQYPIIYAQQQYPMGMPINMQQGYKGQQETIYGQPI